MNGSGGWGLSARGLDDETRVFPKRGIGGAFITDLALFEGRDYLEMEVEWHGRGANHAD